MKKPFDLLSTVEYDGCSAKLPPQVLEAILKEIQFDRPQQLLVGAETSDDAAVWKIDENSAIIHTTDFFPPICSDPYEFGAIAAANALSDIFAMGGKPLTALNLVMFPSTKIDISVLKEILKGGADKAKEAGAVICGGHTIDDYPPKYGLAVTGIVHPDKIIRNCSARAGDVLILTKPVGTGAIVAGQRIGMCSREDYQSALDTMKQLNRAGAEIMQKYNVKCATDITGFSVLGHALEMAKGSGVSIEIDASKVPQLCGAYELIDAGCIPGASFRNLKFVEEHVEFADDLDYNLKMLMLDPQTSGGLLISCTRDISEHILKDLSDSGYHKSSIVGRVLENNSDNKLLHVILNSSV